MFLYVTLASARRAARLRRSPWTSRPDGSAPNGKTGRQVAISADGRFVGFISRATNLAS